MPVPIEIKGLQIGGGREEEWLWPSSDACTLKFSRLWSLPYPHQQNWTWVLFFKVDHKREALSFHLFLSHIRALMILDRFIGKPRIVWMWGRRLSAIALL